jgi:cytidylate kinase
MTPSLRDKALDIANNFTVALDGPSASGKGHIGKLLAREFSLEYFQSSLVYRGLARLCIDKNVELQDELGIIKLSMFNEIIDYAKNYDLADENIGNIASKLSTISEVRKNLSIHLEKIIVTTSRLIMEGRDIGTVIAPNADLKIFLTADVERRAERRYKQLLGTGKKCILHEILEQLKERDARDESRSSSPLIPAIDALVIDTSNLSPQQVFEVIDNFIQTK